MSRPALLALLLLGGCARPGPTPVWVDIDRVPRPAPPPGAAPIAGLPGEPARSLTLPSRPAERLGVRGGATPEEIAALLRRGQTRARRRLADLLRRFAAEEIAGLTAGETTKLDAAARERASEREVAFRARFERYADLRAPLAVELAFLAGFPDSGREPSDLPETQIVRRRELARAAAVRKEIAELDAAFVRDTEKLLAEDEALDAAARADLLVRIERKRAELERTADEEAARQVPLDLDRIPGRRLAEGAVTLPAVPGSRVDLPATAPLPGTAGVPSATAAETATEWRERLAGERRVFLAERGWTLRRGAPDRTAAFLRWRTTFLPPAPSATSPPSSAASSSAATPPGR